MLDLDETECRVTLIADLPFAGIAALPEGTNLERRFIIGPRAAARVAAHPSLAPGRRGDRAVRQFQQQQPRAPHDLHRHARRAHGSPAGRAARAGQRQPRRARRSARAAPAEHDDPEPYTPHDLT